MTYSPLTIANSFIERFGRENAISHMKLQKLVFFADGWNMAFNDQRLVSERPQVWRYGPVFRSLYHALTGHGNKSITEPVKETPFQESAIFVERDKGIPASNLIDWIWSRYGGFTATNLSEQTHAAGTPWRVLAEQHQFAVPLNLEINDELTKTYFQGMARAEGLLTN